MLLGLHTNSFHLHEMEQNWGGHKLAWEPVWDIFGLMDEAQKLVLNGLHLREHSQTLHRFFTRNKKSEVSNENRYPRGE